jgi:Fe-S-cluster containining protein
MNPAADSDPELVQAHVELDLPGGNRLEADVSVPRGLVPASKLVPMARALSEQIVGLTVLQAEESGRCVSCGPGCGACCRQLAPISETEARMIAQLVEALPEPRRTVIQERFAATRRRLDEAGLLAPLRDDSRNFWSKDETRHYAFEYFRQDIPCPFLEDESCSIHPERPLVCREYLVTSDPIHCAEIESKKIEGIHLPAHVWAALARISETPSSDRTPPWVPLSLALDWVEAHPEEPLMRPGPEVFREFFQTVAGMVALRCKPIDEGSPLRVWGQHESDF